MKIKFIANIKGIYLGYSFDQSAEITIGREIGNTIAPINVDGFSRHGGWYVEDLGSTNGTYRNRVKIEAPAKIEKGDSIRCGLMELASFDFMDAAPGATIPAPAQPQPTEAPKPAAPVEPVKPIAPLNPIAPIKPIAPPKPAESVAPLEPVAALEPVEDLPPVTPLESGSPSKTGPVAPPVSPTAALRRPALPGLKPGIKLPQKPGALGAGLKLPPKPGLSAGLKLPPKPGMKPGLKLPVKPAKPA